MSPSRRDKITYEQARADHEYLWDTYGPADDMTGGYEDQYDLAKLLKNPSKKTALDCYSRQIAYWFDKGPQANSGMGDTTWENINWHDFKVIDIAVRHGLISEDDSMNADFLGDLFSNRGTLLRKKKEG